MRTLSILGSGAMLVASLALASPASAVPLWPDEGVGAWGRGSEGEIGDGNTTANNTSPVVTDQSGVLAGKVVTNASAGNGTSCVVASAAAYCWGSRTAGKVGDGGATSGNQLTPVAVATSGVLNGKALTTISVGGSQVCALDTDGAAYCWGSGTFGQLGNGGSAASASPVAVTMPASKTFVSIAAGHTHTCAATADGLAYCWGANDRGQVGVGNLSTGPLVPTAVDATGALSGKNVTQVAAGFDYSCAVASGAAYCWGEQDGGKLGNGFLVTADITSPVAVGGLSGKTVTQITTSGSSGEWTAESLRSGSQGFTCAVADGRAYCWGYGGLGRLGTGNEAASASPIPVFNGTGGALHGKTIRTIAAGWDHGCASTTDFQAACWGSGSNGQLGSSSSGSNVPLAINTPDAFKVGFSSSGAPRPVMGVTAGKDFTLGLYGSTGYPGAPQNLAYDPDDGDTLLTWSAPFYTGTTALKWYFVMYRPAGSGSFKTFARIPVANGTSFDIVQYAASGCPAGSLCVRAYGGLTAGNSYDFQILATNNLNGGRPSNTVTATPLVS